ncbi:MAG TPA: sulfite reductase subunit alpha, partial [Terrimicrobiaceae bacterium]|nr:sulfite reductase subunit alpha [Terrimicrobiaceae bacterium]
SPTMSTESASGYSRKNPFPATIAVNRKLTGEGSNKDTRHLEINLSGSGLAYEVGDSLGIFPKNDTELVEGILKNQGFTGDEQVTNPDGKTVSLREALTKDFIITEPSKQLLQVLPEKDSSSAFLRDLLDPGSKNHLDDYVWGRDVLDLLEELTAAKFTPEELVKVLRKLQPRLYSIASSQKAVGESVHLTVAVVRYQPERSSHLHRGVCSTFLAERAEGNGKVPVFVHTAKHFRIPENADTPTIMVGPGTGIAPFRAFLQERKALGVQGKNWLFFGEQKAASDYFYGDEFEAWQADGVLTRFTTAFSRDQDHKIYVQHRMLENAAELYDWLENGAIFYVCGDAARMAKDVDTALHQIVEQVGSKSTEQAKEYVDALKKEKRYRKDVY